MGIQIGKLNIFNRSCQPDRGFEYGIDIPAGPPEPDKRTPLPGATMILHLGAVESALYLILFPPSPGSASVFLMGSELQSGYIGAKKKANMLFGYDRFLRLYSKRALNR